MSPQTHCRECDRRARAGSFLSAGHLGSRTTDSAHPAVSEQVRLDFSRLAPGIWRLNKEPEDWGSSEELPRIIELKFKERGVLSFLGISS